MTEEQIRELLGKLLLQRDEAAKAAAEPTGRIVGISDWTVPATAETKDPATGQITQVARPAFSGTTLSVAKASMVTVDNAVAIYCANVAAKTPKSVFVKVGVAQAKARA